MKHITLSIVLLISTPLIAMDEPDAQEAELAKHKLATEPVEREKPEVFAARKEEANPFPSNPLRKSTDFGSHTSDSNPSKFNNPEHGMPGHRCPAEQASRGLGSSPFDMPGRSPREELLRGAGSSLFGGMPSNSSDEAEEIASFLMGSLLPSVMQRSGAPSVGGLDPLVGSRKSTIVLSLKVPEQTPLMKLMTNADSIHDILLKASPIFIAWTKNPNTNNTYTTLDPLTRSLRSEINTQDDLLTQELEQKFGQTQAFKRLHALSNGIRTPYSKLGQEHETFIQTFTLEQPEHSINNFARTLIPLSDRLERIVNTYDASNYYE